MDKQNTTPAQRDEQLDQAIAHARRLYINHPHEKPLTYKTISEAVGIAPRVISQHARAEDWRAMHKATLATAAAATISDASQARGVPTGTPAHGQPAKYDGKSCPMGHSNGTATKYGGGMGGDNSPSTRTIQAEQRARIDRLKAAIDEHAEIGVHDPTKLQALVRATDLVHDLERRAHGIEEKPQETRAVALLPAGVTPEEWQRQHEAPAEDDQGAAGAELRRH